MKDRSDFANLATVLYNESKLVRLIELLDSEASEVPVNIPVDDIRERVDRLTRLRDVCLTDDGWKLQKDAQGVRTLYQHHPSRSHIHSFRLEGEVEAPVFFILSLLHEVDLFHKWIPTFSLLGLNFARLVDHPSPTELLVHLNINVPWPFTNRYCFFHCEGIDCMDDADSPQIGVVLNNLTSEESYEIKDEAVKTDFHAPSGVLLTPLAKGTTKVQVVANLDPRIAFVPEWLIDIAVRNLAFLIILRIRKAVEIVKADPEYHKRMQDPLNDFYNHIRKRIKESLPGEYIVEARADSSEPNS